MLPSNTRAVTQVRQPLGHIERGLPAHEAQATYERSCFVEYFLAPALMVNVIFLPLQKLQYGTIRHAGIG